MAMPDNRPVTRKDMKQLNEQMKNANTRSTPGITGKGGKNVAPLYKASVTPVETLPRKVDSKFNSFTK